MTNKQISKYMSTTSNKAIFLARLIHFRRLYYLRIIFALIRNTVVTNKLRSQNFQQECFNHEFIITIRLRNKPLL